jgi:hypothetical protein
MQSADTQTWMPGRVYEICSTIRQDMRDHRRETREDFREVHRELRSLNRRLSKMKTGGGSDIPRMEKWFHRTLQIAAPLATLYVTGSLQEAAKVALQFIR